VPREKGSQRGRKTERRQRRIDEVSGARIVVTNAEQETWPREDSPGLSKQPRKASTDVVWGGDTHDTEISTTNGANIVKHRSRHQAIIPSGKKRLHVKDWKR